MNLRELRLKPHLVFVSALFCVLAFNMIIGFRAGETFLGETWRTISEIRPMEYAIFALFWYASAVHRPKDDWESSFITLNLSRSNQK